MKNGEFLIQKAFFEWVAYSKKKYPELNLMYAIPNGGQRNIITAMNLKLTGTKAGIPDIHLPVPCGGYSGFWIEFKFGKNKLSPEQIKYKDLLEMNGHRVCVCYSVDDAIKLVEEYLNPKRRMATY